MTIKDKVEYHINRIQRLNKKEGENDDNAISLGLLKAFSERMISENISIHSLTKVMNEYSIESMNFFIIKMAIRYINSPDKDKLFTPWQETNNKVKDYLSIWKE